eukprot:g47161.t1
MMSTQAYMDDRRADLEEEKQRSAISAHYIAGLSTQRFDLVWGKHTHRRRNPHSLIVHAYQSCQYHKEYFARVLNAIVTSPIVYMSEVSAGCCCSGSSSLDAGSSFADDWDEAIALGCEDDYEFWDPEDRDAWLDGFDSGDGWD